jgi:RNA polymerase sigma factor (sigma-70 family)
MEERFLRLLDEHKRILYKVASVYCAQAEDRRDLVQEMVIHLWRSFPRYQEQFTFSTWMYRIAVNVAISFYRGERRHRQTLPLLEMDLAAADRVMGDDLRLLRELVAQLDELNRALMLLYLEGYSHAEIAELLGISATNVSTRMDRIRKQFRDEMNPGDPV